MSEHFVGKVTVKGIIKMPNLDLVLVSRDVHDEDTWELPGGRLHDGETVEAALTRELWEELEVQVNIGPLVHTEQFRQSRDGTLSLLLVFVCTLDPVTPFMIDPKEVAEVQWVNRETYVEKKMYDNCRNALDAFFRVPKIP